MYATFVDCVCLRVPTFASHSGTYYAFNFFFT